VLRVGVGGRAGSPVVAGLAAAWGRGAEDSMAARVVEYWSATRATRAWSASVRRSRMEEEVLRLCCVWLRSADGDRRESA
jgi:hypothetical protein